MRAVRGSTVTINYIGTLDNGRIFHSTEGEGPLTFTIGNDQVFPALEQAVIGMACGDSRNVEIAAVDAYGLRIEDNVIRVSRQLFPADREVRAGQKLGIEFKGGEKRNMLVKEVTESFVTLDGNHPLAGCSLTFALRVDHIE